MRKGFDERHQEIANMLQDLVDSAVDGLVQDQSFLRRVADGMQSTAIARAEAAARAEVQRLSENVSSARAAEVADGMLQAARTASRRMYLLATVAAAIGVAAAATVYVLLA